MIMSNFIDESERHAELYNVYTPRQHLIFELVEDLRLKISINDESYTKLNAMGICNDEIDWLKRTGRLLPSF